MWYSLSFNIGPNIFKNSHIIEKENNMKLYGRVLFLIEIEK